LALGHAFLATHFPHFLSSFRIIFLSHLRTELSFLRRCSSRYLVGLRGLLAS
jgi:hypothetical protein